MNKLLKLSLPILLILGLILTSACAPAQAPPLERVPSMPPVPMPTPTPSPMSIPKTTSGEDIPQLWDVSGGAGQSSVTEHMIVRIGNIALIVEDVPATIERTAALADSLGGYVVSSNRWGEDERLAGSIAIRVPSEHFDNALKVLREMAVDVTSESTSSKDVTAEYVDLSAKLQNLEATEKQLSKIMEKAETVDDILNVQRELTKTRGEIEQTKGRMQYLERTSAMSLIEVHLEQAKLSVSFAADRAAVKPGQNIRFTSHVAGGFTPYSYEWEFGDGNTSTDKTPTHKYKTSGSYTVILKVSDDQGNTDTETRNDYITVLTGWSASNVASGAWNGLVGFGHVLANIFIWIGIFAPVWLVIGGVVYWLRRRKRKNSGNS